MSDLVCGIDLGGTKVLGLVGHADGGEPLAVERVSTPRGADAVLDAVVGLAQTLAVQVERSGAGSVVAYGLGAPGLVDRSGRLRYGPNVPGIVDVALRDLLSKRLEAPVAVDNDATCAAWAEHRLGAARGVANSLTVTLGTGIGAGIVVDGELLRGSNGFAGEPGHMVVDPTGPLCPCGRHGCWERFASGSGLAMLGRRAAEAGAAPGLLDRADGDAERITGEHVTTAAADSDAGALAVIATFCGWVALGVANLVNVLDVDLVVIGGGLVEASAVLLGPICDAFEGQALGAGHRDDVPIVAAELGERAGAWGAALLADERR